MLERVGIAKTKVQVMHVTWVTGRKTSFRYSRDKENTGTGARRLTAHWEFTSCRMGLDDATCRRIESSILLGLPREGWDQEWLRASCRLQGLGTL